MADFAALSLGHGRVAFADLAAEVATEVGSTPEQVTLAWMLAKGSRVIPIPGSSRPETAIASAAAADVTLTPDQVARLDAA